MSNGGETEEEEEEAASFVVVDVDGGGGGGDGDDVEVDVETSAPPLATLLAHPSTALATASTDLSTDVLSTAGTRWSLASDRRWSWIARMRGRAATYLLLLFLFLFLFLFSLLFFLEAAARFELLVQPASLG